MAPVEKKRKRHSRTSSKKRSTLQRAKKMARRIKKMRGGDSIDGAIDLILNKIYGVFGVATYDELKKLDEFKYMENFTFISSLRSLNNQKTEKNRKNGGITFQLFTSVITLYKELDFFYLSHNEKGKIFIEIQSTIEKFCNILIKNSGKLQHAFSHILNDAKDTNSIQKTMEQLEGTAAVPEPVTAAVPEPVTAAVPEPVTAAVPEPVTAAVPEPVTAAVPEPVTAAVPEPVTAAVPEPVTATVPEPVTAAVQAPIPVVQTIEGNTAVPATSGIVVPNNPFNLFEEIPPTKEEPVINTIGITSSGERTELPIKKKGFFSQLFKPKGAQSLNEEVVSGPITKEGSTIFELGKPSLKQTNSSAFNARGAVQKNARLANNNSKRQKGILNKLKNNYYKSKQLKQSKKPALKGAPTQEGSKMIDNSLLASTIGNGWNEQQVESSLPTKKTEANIIKKDTPTKENEISWSISVEKKNILELIKTGKNASTATETAIVPEKKNASMETKEVATTKTTDKTLLEQMKNTAISLGSSLKESVSKLAPKPSDSAPIEPSFFTLLQTAADPKHGLNLFGIRYSFQSMKGAALKAQSTAIIYDIQSLLNHFISAKASLQDPKSYSAEELCKFLDVFVPLFGVGSFGFTSKPPVNFESSLAPAVEDVPYVVGKLEVLNKVLNEKALMIGNVTAHVKDWNRISSSRITKYIQFLEQKKDDPLVPRVGRLGLFDCSPKGIVKAESEAKTVGINYTQDIAGLKRLLKGLLLRGKEEGEGMNDALNAYMKGEDSEKSVVIKKLLEQLKECPEDCMKKVDYKALKSKYEGQIAELQESLGKHGTMLNELQEFIRKAPASKNVVDTLEKVVPELKKGVEVALQTEGAAEEAASNARTMVENGESAEAVAEAAAPVVKNEVALETLKENVKQASNTLSVAAEAEPVVEPDVGQAAKPVAEPVVEPDVGQAVELKEESITKPIVKPDVVQAAEPVAEPVVESDVGQAVELKEESITKPIVKPDVGQAAEPVTEPVEKPVAEHVVEPKAEPDAKLDVESVAITNSINRIVPPTTTNDKRSKLQAALSNNIPSSAKIGLGPILNETGKPFKARSKTPEPESRQTAVRSVTTKNNVDRMYLDHLTPLLALQRKKLLEPSTNKPTMNVINISKSETTEEKQKEIPKEITTPPPPKLTLEGFLDALLKDLIKAGGNAKLINISFSKVYFETFFPTNEIFKNEIIKYFKTIVSKYACNQISAKLVSCLRSENYKNIVKIVYDLYYYFQKYFKVSDEDILKLLLNHLNNDKGIKYEDKNKREFTVNGLYIFTSNISFISRNYGRATSGTFGTLNDLINSDDFNKILRFYNKNINAITPSVIFMPISNKHIFNPNFNINEGAFQKILKKEESNESRTSSTPSTTQSIFSNSKPITDNRIEIALQGGGGATQHNIFQLLAEAQLGGEEEVAEILAQDGGLREMAHFINVLMSSA